MDTTISIEQAQKLWALGVREKSSRYFHKDLTDNVLCWYTNECYGGFVASAMRPHAYNIEELMPMIMKYESDFQALGVKENNGSIYFSCDKFQHTDAPTLTQAVGEYLLWLIADGVMAVKIGTIEVNNETTEISNVPRRVKSYK